MTHDSTSNPNEEVVAIVFRGQLYPNAVGGAEFMARVLSDAFADMGHKVYVFAFGGPNFPQPESMSHFVPMSPSRIRLPLELGRIRKWAGIGFNTVICIGGNAAVIGRFLTGRGTKAIVIYQGDDLKVLSGKALTGSGFGLANFFLQFPLNFIGFALSRSSALQVALNPEMQRYLTKLGVSPSKIKTFPPPIPSWFYAPLQIVESKPMARGHRLIYVGRIVKSKGVEYLLEAFAKLRTRFSDAELLIVGDGPMRYDIQSRVGKLGCTRCVRITGFVDIRRVRELLISSDVFVLPSLREGLSNSVLQAMACGIPVVVSAIEGMSTVVKDHQTGLLAKSRSPDAIIAAVSEVFLNAELAKRLAVNGRKAVEGFSDEQIVRKIESFPRNGPMDLV